MRHCRLARGLAPALLLATLFFAPPAAAQYFGKNKVHYQKFDWKVLETQHFQIYFYAEEADAARDAARMAERSYTRLSHALRHQFNKPIPVVLYATHSQFQQTNILQDLIDEGTGGVTEFAKQRVFLPFTGSYAELEHVLSHELVHAFQIDILYGRGDNILSNPLAVQPPGWFMEGMAEYLSLGGVDPNTAMWLKDGALNGYLLPISTLDYIADIRVYRFGQALWEYIARRYGEEKVGDILRRVGATRNVNRSIEFVLGVTPEKLSDDWLESIRVTYLPQVARFQKTGDFARALTNHEKNESNYNVVPALSPTGEKLTFISDRGLSIGLYLASAIDGKDLGKLGEGERRADFESFRFFTSSADWNPDGKRVLIPVKSGPRDNLLIIDVMKKKVVKRLKYPGIDAITSPCWSPDGSQIVFSGDYGGRSNLYRCDADGKNLEMLTDDRYADREPRYSPDGTKLVFVTDRGPATDFDRLVFGRYRLALFNLADRSVEELPGMSGKNITPFWSADGKEILFVSDRTGINNLFVLNLEKGEVRQVSDLLNGVSGITEGSPPLTVSRDGRRAVFSAFEKAGWDLFAVKEPFALPPITPLPPAPTMPAAERDARVAAGLPPDIVPADPTPGEPGGLERVAMHVPPLAPTLPDSTVDLTGLNAGGPPRGQNHDPRGSDQPEPPPDMSVPRHHEPGGMDATREVVHPDSVSNPAVLDSLRTVLGALPDTSSFRETGYRTHFSTDYASTQAAFGTNNGLAGLATISFSDMLGNKNITVAAGIYGSLIDSDILLQYTDQSRRNDYGISLYQIREDYFLVSRPFQDEYQTQVSRGAELFVSRPVDKFHRFEVNMTAVAVSTKYIATDYNNEQVLAKNPTYFYAQPGIAWVKDTAVYGSVGPIGGARGRLSIQTAVGGIQRTNGLIDYRSYINFARRYSFAWRALYATSAGQDPLIYQIGGPFTTRSVDYGGIIGSHVAVANLELRVPFIDRLATGFPLAMEWPGIRGVLFLDFGTGWGVLNDGSHRSFRPWSSLDGFHFQDLTAAYGFGLRMNLGFLIARYDLAQPTDFSGNLGHAHHFFSIGADF